MSLSAQFVQGVEICETAISEGLYSQAAALLRQELETVAAVSEFEQDRREDGKTPRISNGVMRDSGPIYGDLSGIAHVSKHDLARQLVTIEQGEICAPTSTAQYNRGLAKFMYGNNVYFIFEITRQTAIIFEEVFGEGPSEMEQRCMFSAISILLKEEVVVLRKDA